MALLHLIFVLLVGPHHLSHNDVLHYKSSSEIGKLYWHQTDNKS